MNPQEELNTIIKKLDNLLTKGSNDENLVTRKRELEDILRSQDNNGICPFCNNDGYTVEVVGECCGNSDDGFCCNMPSPNQIQVQCTFCNT